MQYLLGRQASSQPPQLQVTLVIQPVFIFIIHSEGLSWSQSPPDKGSHFWDSGQLGAPLLFPVTHVPTWMWHYSGNERWASVYPSSFLIALEVCCTPCHLIPLHHFKAEKETVDNEPHVHYDNDKSSFSWTTRTQFPLSLKRGKHFCSQPLLHLELLTSC